MLTLGLHMHEMHKCVYTHMQTYEHMHTHTKEVEKLGERLLARMEF